MRLSNGWTGGQYSLYRVILGIYLAVHFIHLIPWGPELFSSAGMLPEAGASPLYPLFPNLLFVWDSPAAVRVMLGAGALLAAAFAAGAADRAAAILLWYIWACLFTRNPLISNPGLPFVGWLLLAHLLVPRGPYGAWHARGLPDPGSRWRMPERLFGASWILLALSYSYSGYTKLASPSWLDGTAIRHVLENPLARPTVLREILLDLPGFMLQAAAWISLALEILFAPLALLRRARPWLWFLLLGMHLSLLQILDFTDLSLGMILIHLFTFDPAWVPPAPPAGRSWIYYDGSCGLCHRFVRFLLSEDREGRAFRFAPLQGERFRREVKPESRDALPDSIVLVTGEGEALTRSEAVVFCGRRLGGLWRLLASVLALVPGGVRDRGYDAVAAVRHRIFARPEEACPLIPEQLRERFEDVGPARAGPESRPD